MILLGIILIGIFIIWCFAVTDRRGPFTLLLDADFYEKGDIIWTEDSSPKKILILSKNTICSSNKYTLWVTSYSAFVLPTTFWGRIWLFIVVLCY